ncbi:MAG: HD domain-containing protein [Alphaproteobacteria bacterium]
MKKEINLLHDTYQKTLDIVKSDDDCKAYAYEKIRHSLQVVGAGNYIFKHEVSFQNKPQDFVKCAKTAYILHDIGRFREIEEIYYKSTGDNEYNLNKSPVDHGTLGAMILAEMPEYNDPRIILPVRHHGHLIEEFYQDEDYLAIKDEDLKNDIKQILFLAMDADKIANFYMLKQEFDNHIKAWLPATDKEFIYGPINPIAIDCFKERVLYPRSEIKSNSDDLVATISWMFDINHQTSIDFCKRHNLVEAIMKIVARYNNQSDVQEELTSLVKQYLNEFKPKAFK